MKKAIKLLSLVNENNFIEIYFVCIKQKERMYSIESIAFLTREEAQKHCDWLNNFNKTNKFSVYRTCAEV